MWLKKSPSVDWSTATDHLCRVDPRLAAVIERAGPCTLKPGRDCFWALCRAIISQQISGNVAVAIGNRSKSSSPARGPLPSIYLRLTEGQSRPAAPSRQKRPYRPDLPPYLPAGKV